MHVEYQAAFFVVRFLKCSHFSSVVPRIPTAGTYYAIKYRRNRLHRSTTCRISDKTIIFVLACRISLKYRYLHGIPYISGLGLGPEGSVEENRGVSM